MKQFVVALILLLFGGSEASATTIREIAAAVDQRDDVSMIRGLADRAESGDACSAFALWFLQTAARTESVPANATQRALQAAGIDGDETPVGLNLLRALADKGDTQAILFLGMGYSGDVGIPADPATAESWYGRYATYAVPAAESGDANAQWNLTSFYQLGLGGLPKDDGQMIKWARKAAEQGHGAAQFDLGRMYETGKGVPKDPAEAMKWFRRAAENGVAEAQRKVGNTYWFPDQSGSVVSKDSREAMKWFLEAANQGDLEAQNALGSMYKDGDGTLQDYLSQTKSWTVCVSLHTMASISSVVARSALRCTPSRCAHSILHGH